jgi:hypothetical protein
MNRRTLVAGAFVLAFVGVAVRDGIADRQAASQPDPRPRWFKGNTHTHTLNSDGDSTPDEVVRWYREHGYQFLVLTDHNFPTVVDGLNAVHAADNRFLVIRGEEVTSAAEGKPVHVNALDPRQGVGRQSGSTIAEVLQRSVDGIRAASGIPHINHPNFGWALTTEQLRGTRDYKLLEIYNGHPEVNNLGGGGAPGLEEIWDQLLSSGKLVYGIAVDDAHNFKDPGNPRVSGPGRGWVVVRAARLDARSIVEALERGEFYASTGVVLEDVRATPASLTVEVKPDGTSKFRLQFIGRTGVLREVTEPKGTYMFRGDEGFVRARVLESNGRSAWVQPVMVARQ